MTRVVRQILAIIAGVVAGSILNMGLILLSDKVIPPPPGADVTTMEGLKASIHLFEAKHFVFPFLAHALGTLAGAFIAATIVRGTTSIPANIVGCIFLAGGIANTIMIPAPEWFDALDIAAAYLPMAWVGHTLGTKMSMRHREAEN